MATYYPIKWGDYAVQVNCEGLTHLLSKMYSFFYQTDIIPFFYSTYISYELMIRRNTLLTKKTLGYEWRLVNSETDEQVSNKYGAGEIKLHRLWVLKFKSKAIDIGRLKKNQYKLQMRLTDGDKASSFFDVTEFTIKDKDEFGGNLFLMIGSAIIGGIIGAIIGSNL
ncbi:MAG: hypothetical protein PHR43_00710 [Dehalococcoidales bacterium]|nr:hypothetical protein [Dehalococcoidales bacterium]